MIFIGMAAAIGVGAYAQTMLCRRGMLWGLYTAVAYLLAWAVLSIASLGDFGTSDRVVELMLDLAAALFASLFVSAMARKVSR